MAAAAAAQTSAPHIPVLLRPLMRAIAPVRGAWLDGTFGAGGYTRALLDAGADRVIAVDRDPLAFELAADWADAYGDRLVQQQGVFSRMDEYGERLDGVVLDPSSIETNIVFLSKRNTVRTLLQVKAVRVLFYVIIMPAQARTKVSGLSGTSDHCACRSPV